MDRFKIEGGRKLEGTVRISGAKNAALAGHGGGAAHRRSRTSEKYPARARHHHHGQAARAHALQSGKPGHPAERIHDPRRKRLARRSALRAGENDARLGADARAAGRAIRLRARFASRRLRHRRAAHRPAHSGARKARRDDHRRSRIRRSARPTGCAAPRSASRKSPSPARKTFSPQRCSPKAKPSSKIARSNRKFPILPTCS